MPAMKLSMSRSTALPSLPARFSCLVCWETTASVCALGLKLCRPEISPIALRPGASMAATREL